MEKEEGKKKMNKKEINEILKEIVELNKEIADGRSLPDYIEDMFLLPATGAATGEITLPRGVSVSLQEQFGGEGKGEDWWAVYKVTKGEESAFIQFNAYYSSYNGHEYHDEDFLIVEPKEVMVTQWFEIK